MTKKYDHWCVRIQNADGLITTASIPGAVKKELVAKAGGVDALVALVKTVGKKCRKEPGGRTVSAQVRERVQTVLARRARETSYLAKTGRALVWPTDVNSEGDVL